MHRFSLILIPETVASVDIMTYITGRLLPYTLNNNVKPYINRYLRASKVSDLTITYGIDHLIWSKRLEALSKMPNITVEDKSVCLQDTLSSPLIKTWEVGGRFAGVWSKPDIPSNQLGNMETNTYIVKDITTAHPEILITDKDIFLLPEQDPSYKYKNRITDVLSKNPSKQMVILDIDINVDAFFNYTI